METTIDVLLAMLALSLVASGVLTLVKGSFPGSVLLWVAGLALGTLLVIGSGLFWVNLLMPDTYDSQAGGILTLVVFLPFFAVSGLLIGAWSVAWGYFLAPSPSSLLWFQGVGLLGSVVLGGLLPGLIAVVLGYAAQPLETYDPDQFLNLIVLATAVLIGSFITAPIAHGLTLLVMRRFS